jgi:hypothetical protein
MDLDRILEEMHAERERLDVSIRAIEMFAAAGPKRRGRPPKWMTQSPVVSIPARRGRPRAATKRPR